MEIIITPEAADGARGQLENPGPPSISPKLGVDGPLHELECRGRVVDEEDNFLGGGRFFLKGHGNEGIVAAQYDLNGVWHFEFNVGWHHGEGGGPVLQHEPLAGFAVMQYYRNIQSPHGEVARPHCGRALDAIQQQLIACNATIV